MNKEFNFETIRRHSSFNNVGEDEIYIQKSHITFGKEFFKILNKKFLEVMQDKEKGVIAFRGTDNKPVGYMLERRTNCIITSLPSRWMVPKGSVGVYKGEIKNGLIIMRLNEKYKLVLQKETP